MNHSSPSHEVLQKLRQEIRRLEGFKAEVGAVPPLSLGVDLGDCLPGGALAAGAIHEFISNGYEDAAATVAFTLGILSRQPRLAGPIVWIARDAVEYAPGFAGFGIDPQRIIFARPARDAQALAVMEEALRYKGIAAVVGESAQADLTATRRLQLAAEESGVICLLLRTFCRAPGTSSCVTRWQVKPAASIADNGLPGLGPPRWQVELLKARGGRPGSWLVEWRGNALHLVHPPATRARDNRAADASPQVIQLPRRA